MEVILSVLWGAVIGPLLVCILVLMVLLILSLWFKDQIIFQKMTQFFWSLLPFVGFSFAWRSFLGWPEVESFSGMDGLLLSIPVAVGLSLGISRRRGFGVLLFIWVGAVSWYLLRPLAVSDPMTWMVLLTLLTCISLWFFKFFFVFYSESHGHSLSVIASEVKVSQFLAKVSSLISYLGTGVILAFYMLMWGSASSAQILGGFLASLGLMLCLEVAIGVSQVKGGWLMSSMSLASKIVPREWNWIWIFFYWEGINAHFYLDVPLPFLIAPLLLMLFGSYWAQSVGNRRFSGSLRSRLLVLFAITIVTIAASIGWSLLAKPKSFY